MNAKILLFFFGLVALCLSQDPSYDHQTTTYNSQFQPVNATGTITITPFFSPYTPILLETEMINAATTSIDIGIPGFDSWNYCDCSTGSVPPHKPKASNGCPVSQVHTNESFPIFAALLNAVHRGVTVRLLTNNYNSNCDPDMIDPLTFLSLAGAQVRYFTTTTFIHSKYMTVDGKRSAVSSVNYSYTSFLENREAGVVIEGDDAQPLIAFMTKVFEFDWAQAGPWPANSYSADDMAIINDQTIIPIPIPEKRNINMYFPSVQPVTESMTVGVFASPDFASYTVFSNLNTTSNNFGLYIYQVTTPDFCNQLQSMATSVPNFKMLVSAKIYDQQDQDDANTCYTQLYNAGVSFYKTNKSFRYCHQKFWILDNQNVFMSTGNWGDSDYPSGQTFPPYGNSGWQKVNRDFTVWIQSANVVSQFQKVFDADYAKGYPWSPAK